ncbi:MAG: cupin domain-containing protein [Pseudomonadota bacterium]
MNVHQVDWNAIPWEPVREGVSRKSFAGEGATLALHKLAPGHEPKPHQHPNEQIVYILAGQIRFHIGDQDEQVLLSAGGLLVVPPNTMHWGEVVGNEDVLNLDVFTPKRPEYGG